MMLDLLSKYPIKTVTPLEEDYPRMLRYIKDPPSILYYRGDIKIASNISISVVGSRHATGYGKWAAQMLGRKLAEYEIVTVSGMAAGIDTYAHKGSLENKGKTIAVFGCGVDVCYPKINKDLMIEILENGLVLSEFPPEFQPTNYSFPIRNRIISGLSAGTVIVEAGISSGSLITAEYAAEQGRNLYAVPGNINNIYSIGTNKLIKDGAVPITVVDDIIDELGIKRRESIQLKTTLGKDEIIIYEAIETGSETTVDSICKTTRKGAGEVNAMITVLEMKGLIYSCMGKIFVAK